MGAPIRSIFGQKRWSRPVSWTVDLISIYAIAIGLGGSVALGVFQIQDGVATLLNMDGSGLELTLIIFIILCLAYMLPLMTDLSKGMALLSNTAIIISITIMVYLLLAGPTYFMMNGVVESIGEYLFQVIPHGFRTYTFYGEQVGDWFGDWTLNYMVWWLAWSPFVGVFIARISRGRTIREFILGILLAPTAFSIFWFAVFGGLGAFQAQAGLFDPSVAIHNINQTTFMLLKTLPLSQLTIAAIIVAGFLFVVTSVVSAAYVLSMFSTGGDQDPTVKIKLIWGVILAALGLAMILSNSVSAVRQIIALSANPFLLIVLLLLVCLLKALRKDKVSNDG
jgi:glycine betaine transporter